jgi:hypothetical protein
VLKGTEIAFVADLLCILWLRGSESNLTHEEFYLMGMPISINLAIILTAPERETPDGLILFRNQDTKTATIFETSSVTDWWEMMLKVG